MGRLSNFLKAAQPGRYMASSGCSLVVRIRIHNACLIRLGSWDRKQGGWGSKIFEFVLCFWQDGSSPNSDQQPGSQRSAPAPAPARSYFSRFSFASPSVSSSLPHYSSAHFSPFPLLENGEQMITSVGQGREGWLVPGTLSS